jgi:hypothetical protein
MERRNLGLFFNEEFENIWKWLQLTPLGGLREATKNVSHNSWFLGRGLIPGSREYKREY